MEKFVKVNKELIMASKINNKILLTHMWLIRNMNTEGRIGFNLDRLEIGCGERFRSNSFDGRFGFRKAIQWLIDEGIWSAKKNDCSDIDIEMSWDKIKRFNNIFLQLNTDKYFSNWKNKWIKFYYKDYDKITSYCSKELQDMREGADKQKIESGKMVSLYALMLWKNEENIYARYIKEMISRRKEAKAEKIMAQIEKEDDWRSEWGIPKINNNSAKSIKMSKIKKEMKDYREQWFKNPDEILKTKNDWFKAYNPDIKAMIGIDIRNSRRYFDELVACGMIEMKLIGGEVGVPSNGIVRWVKICDNYTE